MKLKTVNDVGPYFGAMLAWLSGNSWDAILGRTIAVLTIIYTAILIITKIPSAIRTVKGWCVRLGAFFKKD